MRQLSCTMVFPLSNWVVQFSLVIQHVAYKDEHFRVLNRFSQSRSKARNVSSALAGHEGHSRGTWESTASPGHMPVE